MAGFRSLHLLAFLVRRGVSFLLPETIITTRFFIALGFLPGKEVKQAKIGNLGLQDREWERLHSARLTHPIVQNASH
jgi:hypothetical protein